MKLRWLCVWAAVSTSCASCPPCEVQAPATPPPCASRQANPDRVPAPRTPTTPGSGSETRTQQVIASVVVRNREKIRACYELERAKDPSLRGTLTLHFTLDPQGNVVQANVVPERSTLQRPSLHECALSALRTIAFPPSSRGFESQVNYPFDFKPQ